MESTFFPTICGGAGSLNSARIDGARSTSEGELPPIRRLAEQHPGHLERIGTMVRRPRLVVVQHELVAQFAQGRRPRRAIAAAIADDQVRRSAVAFP